MTVGGEKNIFSQAEIDYLRFNSYVSIDHEIVYVSTPKVACTVLKWWFSKLTNHSEVIASCNESVETALELKIHDCYSKVAPHVTHLDKGVFVGLISSSENFVFALTKNPFKRIFSAWQSKLLLREPYQSEVYSGESFFSLPVGNCEQIGAAFEAFLEYLVANEAPIFKDVHWTPQVDFLCPDKIDYSFLGKIEEPNLLEKALSEHMGEKYVSPFSSKRENESLLPFSHQFITRRAEELIRSLYEGDFEMFGYSQDLPEGKLVSNESIKTALHAVQMIRSRHKRFSEAQSQVSTKQFELGVAQSNIAHQAGELEAYRTQAVEFGNQIKALQRELEASQSHIAHQTAEIEAYRTQTVHQASELETLNAKRADELASARFLSRRLMSLVVEKMARAFTRK